MIRNLGLALALTLVLGLAPTTRAQTMAYGAGVGGSAPDFYVNQPYGGFGLEYAQPLAAGSVVMDQYGLLHEVPYVPYVQSATPIVPVRPVAPARTSRSASTRAVRQPQYQLTTGSLGSPTGNGGILYTPSMRYESYGNGYGRGPYGVTDYSQGWKGWTID